MGQVEKPRLPFRPPPPPPVSPSLLEVWRNVMHKHRRTIDIRMQFGLWISFIVFVWAGFIH